MSDTGDRRQQRLAPSAYMRQLRPELYSDSADRSAYILDGPTLDYRLETITSRNQTQPFEIFCRKLCERTICPNLLPATGPEGGGDSKADTETIPIADEIATLTYVGEANAGRERWAFAFSAKKKWSQKVRTDVAEIVATGRGYQRIYCVTARFARAKDRARIEDELSRRYGVDVRILDRTWIVEQIVDGDRKDLAFNYLGIGQEVADATRLGKTDYSRSKQLADIEKAISNPESFAGMRMQLVTEALVAARLSRNLERPRVETDGRFARAVRLAESEGTYRQRLDARYEWLWTAFWWFDDIALLNSSYDSFAGAAFESDHAKNLELLCNLTQLLFNCVIHGHLTTTDARLDERVARLCDRLQDISGQAERPNNALEAQTSLLIMRINSVWIHGERASIASFWPQFSSVLKRAKGLGEFDAERLIKMIEVLGNIAGKHDSSYTKLVDELASFVSERTSEAQGALIRLRRAKQLDFDDNLEMIRLLGRAAHQLTKKEHVDALIEASRLLSLAYRSAGLLWAARASSVFAIASIFIQAEEENDIPASVVPTIILWAWISLELRHLPDTLEAIRLLRGSAKVLPLDDASSQRLAENLSQFDLALGSHFLNYGPEELAQVCGLPDVLAGLELYQSRASLLYALGHERLLREDGSIPADEAPEKVADLFTRLASQPVAGRNGSPAVLNKLGREQTYISTVLGMKIKVRHAASEASILAAEAVIGAVEVFFATTLDRDVTPHTEAFDVSVLECADVSEPTFTFDEMRVSATVTWPAGRFPSAYDHQHEVQKMLVSLAAGIFSATCYVKEMMTTLDGLFEDEALLDRLLMVTVIGNSRQRVFKSGVSWSGDWTSLATTTFPLGPSRPNIAPGRPEAPRLNAEVNAGAAHPPTFRRSDHRDFPIRSIIDVHLWDRAKWTGTAFADWGTPYPPALALVFKDETAATAIFQRWRDRFGDVDEGEEIFLGIVRGISSERPAHYRVLVTSRSPSENESSSAGVLVASRIHTMLAESNVNLNNFLDAYRRSNAYLLVPAIWDGQGGPNFRLELAIRKQALSVKLASEISERDLEIIAVNNHTGRRDEP